MATPTRKSVDPCNSCGDPAGYRRHGSKVPSRYDATRWGGKPGVCHECFGRSMREFKATREAHPRGGAARLAPVDPCGHCGTSGGYIPAKQVRPSRRDGSVYGLAPLCIACSATLRSRLRRGTDVDALTGPNHGESRKASWDGWEGRYAEVRGGMLTGLGVGFEAEDVDPLALPYRAAPRSGLESAAAQKTVEAMREAWGRGDMERLREVVFGREVEAEVEQEAACA